MSDTKRTQGKATTREAAISTFIATRGVTRCEPGASGLPMDLTPVSRRAYAEGLAATGDRVVSDGHGGWALVTDGIGAIDYGTFREMHGLRRERAERFAREYAAECRALR